MKPELGSVVGGKYRLERALAAGETEHGVSIHFVTPELDEVIAWLTGYDEAALQTHLDAGTTFEDFFAQVDLNPLASSITGSVCGVRVQDVEDPLMQQIRYLDKLVDELAKGRPMEKVLRS